MAREAIGMNTKLTLQLDKDVIEQAKTYARNQNISLSKLIESILSKLVAEQGDSQISPLVKSLSGVIELSEDDNVREDYTNYLEQKYK